MNWEMLEEKIKMKCNTKNVIFTLSTLFRVEEYSSWVECTTNMCEPSVPSPEPQKQNSVLRMFTSGCNNDSVGKLEGPFTGTSTQSKGVYLSVPWLGALIGLLLEGFLGDHF